MSRTFDHRYLDLASGLSAQPDPRCRARAGVSTVGNSSVKGIDAVDLTAGVHPGRQCLWNELLDGGLVGHARGRLMKQSIGGRETHTHPHAVEIDFPAARGRACGGLE